VKGKKQMGKISVGVMVIAVLFTLGLCKGGWASETGPGQQEETFAGGTIGEGQTQMIGIGEQTPAPHPDRTKEKKAVSTGNTGSTPVILNPGYGQYPTPVLAPTPEH